MFSLSRRPHYRFARLRLANEATVRTASDNMEEVANKDLGPELCLIGCVELLEKFNEALGPIAAQEAGLSLLNGRAAGSPLTNKQ